jgi:predicted metal-binding protein
MTKHTLFVCKSCHRSSEKLAENQRCDGSILLDKITTLSSEKFAAEELEIQPVGCLWACSRGCAVAVSSPEKPTYLLVDLPPDAENASALLEFAQMYIDNRKGAFMWEKLPKELESAIFASIPSVLTKPED